CEKQAATAPADGYTPVPGLDTGKKAELTIAIPYETNKALNTAANAFMSKYPNVSVRLQYVEDYDKNAVQMLQDNAIDIILQKDIDYGEYTMVDEKTQEAVPAGKTTDDYFYNFALDTEIDFSDTTPDITDNYRHVRVDEAGKEIVCQYSYPLGGETRGVFVNKTLLAAYGLTVPANYAEFLACCETLKQNGLIPVQGAGDTAAFSLGLAPAANAVTHDSAALARMAAAEPGVSADFEPTLRKLYTLATKRYFDYKAVEQLGYFLSTNELGQSMSFLGLKTDEATLETIKPENGYGYAAFLPYNSSMGAVIRSLIEQYSLTTDVEFICSPLNDEGTGRAAYITPYYGLCANKNSANLLWIREFVNFIFKAENNKVYAAEAAVLPNTKDVLQLAAEKYGLNPETDVTLCGQIRFSDTYNGFSPISTALKNVLKGSAQKYMVNLNKDENGNIQYETDETGRRFLYLGDEKTVVYEEYVGEEDSAMPGYAFCTMAYYLDGMEASFAAYRVE
ncbi:MAG: extracellular solute-binding protein, partial [Eubacteriales bacterium]|nr:extracellular solute-binding protein [Eubacteriales bacterium]